MKKAILIVLTLISTMSVYAQNGKIIGQIKDNNNIPLIGVNVILQNTTIGTQTHPSGDFTLVNIKKGEYILQLSYLGYKTKEIKVNVGDNSTTDLSLIKMYEGNEILDEFVVKGERINKFSRKQTAYVSKLPLKDIENSQVYSTITNDLLESQLITNFEHALQNAVGVEKLWESTGRGGDGAGYYVLRGFNVQPQLVNGLPGLTNGTINDANVERIEVLKGPSATLFGSTVTSYGGLINVVTKKPYKGFGGRISYTTGSYGLNRISGDFNTALDDKKNIYFRLNTSYHTEDSYQDAGFKKSFFVAPSLSYQVNNKLSFSFYSEISAGEQTNPAMLFLNRAAPSKAKNLDELNYNNKLSFTSNDLSIKNPTSNYRVEMDYKINDKWRSQTLVSRSHTKTDGYYSYLYDFGALEGTVFTRHISKQNSTSNTTDIQQNFIGDLKLGNIRNRMVIGMDYYHVAKVDNSSGYAFFGNVTADGIISGDNPFTPTVEDDVYNLSKSAADAALASKTLNNITTKTEVYSAYVSDVINFTPTLSAMIGLRLDHFVEEGDTKSNEDDYDQTTLSPKFGVVYQPILDRLSVFANYQNGFSNVAPAIVSEANGSNQRTKTFDPEQANQYEFGVKSNLFNGRLNAMISYYNILVSDRVMMDPDNPQNKIQGGEVESKGFEIELNANPIEGLNIRAGYSKNDSETKKSDNPVLIGDRPLEAGPEDIYNFWANYEIPKGKLKGFGLGAGFNGASERAIYYSGPTSFFTVPAYTIANASLFYKNDKFHVGLKLNNVFDKEYYKGWTTINPQQPRHLIAKFTYQF